MANANAIVDQLKELGLRHGEKAGVALASTVFIVCVAMAARQETIATSPDQIKKAAQLSESNLNRPEKRETIIEKLAEKGIKDSDFAKVVDEQVKTALVPENYKSARGWVTPEPGAGLIRDQPTLIAVTELYAYPGRGGLLVYELDKEGNRIPDPDKGKAQPEAKRRRRRRPPAGGMMGGGGGGMMGGAPKKKKRTKSKAERDREAAVELARTEKALQGKLVQGAENPDDAKKEQEKEAAPELPSKEITKGYRWVAITGVLDHAKMVANYRDALKNPAVAHPNYRRLDLQRQELQPDGTWSKWANVDADKNLDVLDNLPEEDDELTPENVRPENLVDPLPFMKAGLWEKVHIASLVPKEKREVPKKNAMADRMGGGMMGPGMGAMAGMMGGGGMDPGEYSKGMGGRMGGGAMRGGGPRGMMMGADAMMGSPDAVGNYWRSDEKKIMIRALDFTVEPDTTYRYRVRIVVFNPNKGREDVNFGVDTKSEDLRGPWSQETESVAMPPDVMPYARGSLPPSAGNDMKVQFQVIRFHPENGVTVPHNFLSSPGEVIGEPRTAEIPVADGTGKKSKVIDFNSHQIVLDVIGNKKTGGYQHLPTGFVGPPIARPALALLLRPDGTVILHNEADDEANDVRKDIDANYRHELSLSTKKRESGVGMGMMGMMGGGMMGGAMRGGGMR